MVWTCFSRRDSQNLYKHGRSNRTGPSPNKGSSLYISTITVFISGTPPSHFVGIPTNVGIYCYRNMRTFNFGLLAVLSCIAMIGATPIGNGAPAEALGRRQGS
jgi:hypothetical protein